MAAKLANVRSSGYGYNAASATTGATNAAASGTSGTTSTSGTTTAATTIKRKSNAHELGRDKARLPPPPPPLPSRQSSASPRRPAAPAAPAAVLAAAAAATLTVPFDASIGSSVVVPGEVFPSSIRRRNSVTRTANTSPTRGRYGVTESKHMDAAPYADVVGGASGRGNSYSDDVLDGVDESPVVVSNTAHAAAAVPPRRTSVTSNTAYLSAKVYHVDKHTVADEKQYIEAVMAAPTSAAAVAMLPAKSRRRSIADDLTAESPRLEEAYQPVFPRSLTHVPSTALKGGNTVNVSRGNGEWAESKEA